VVEIEREHFWLFALGFADELAVCEALDCLQSLGDAVGVDELAEMLLQLVMAVFVEAAVASLMVRFLRLTGPLSGIMASVP
jgi:hypothetical protein